ncbi:ATP-binding protein [Amycolatopsis jejuensis]|uniref:ATP-binding protein n=1 Tax=Amycolatopsis jejuensis TaxID=330084 RepID=UPI0005256CD5|nr:MFS transporter [Amycolatopsis jejuensis]
MSAGGPPHTHTAESFLAEIRGSAERLRDQGRELTGTDGRADRRPFFRLLREEGVGLYPLVAVLALSVSQLLLSQGAAVLAPDMGKVFGVGPEFFTVTGLLGQVIAIAVPLGVARLVQNRACRAAVLLTSAVLWCGLSAYTAFVPSLGFLMVLMFLDGATTAAGSAVSGPLLVDLFPPRVRLRVLAVDSAAIRVATVAAPLLVALLSGPLGLNWRGIHLAMAVLGAVFVAVAFRLRDPGYGQYDTELIRKAAREERGSADGERALAVPKLTLSEAIRRIVAIPSQRWFFASAIVGAMAAPLSIYLAFFLQDQFNLDATERSLLAAGTGAVALVSYLVFAPIGDRLFQRNVRLVFVLNGVLSLIGIALSTAQVFMPSVTALVLFSLAGSALAGLSGPAMQLGMMSVVPAQLRPHVGGLSMMCVLAGTAISTALLGGLASALGMQLLVALMAVPQIAGVVLTIVAGRHVRADLDRMIDEVVEDETVDRITASGARLPMLTCRGLDFRYGTQQILFGVDLTVDDGELVALLGVNGAGKSTLLRVVSGLGRPSAGSIRLDGHDITHIDAERRTVLGITQVPGGHAVFGELTVQENLRCYGFTLGRGRRKLDAALDEAFAAMPALAELRHRRAATLSGGEQQMLGLAKASLLQPRLLLLDELSLGLAPKVVAQLVQQVQAINARGTSVLVVEQSVSTALELAGHAYFMENGEIRFDGSTRELAARPDLLRAVFLPRTTPAEAL